jgi:NADH:ubiquinone oxidoreductase subunit 3 (subunit A)
MSRLLIIILSLAVGAVVAVGAAFATSAVATRPPTPSNQAAYNYGT